MKQCVREKERKRERRFVKVKEFSFAALESRSFLRSFFLQRFACLCLCMAIYCWHNHLWNNCCMHIAKGYLEAQGRFEVSEIILRSAPLSRLLRCTRFSYTVIIFQYLCADGHYASLLVLRFVFGVSHSLEVGARKKGIAAYRIYLYIFKILISLVLEY